MKWKTLILAGISASLVLAGSAGAQQYIANLRGAAITENITPPPMREQSDTDVREVRSYPEQPPVIPHAIEGYQVTANFNKCLDCHSRTAIGRSQAPMVSVTHFMDRDGQFLAQVSPRRYFCTQCHVPQHPSATGVENTFIDVETLIANEAKQ